MIDRGYQATHDRHAGARNHRLLAAASSKSMIIKRIAGKKHNVGADRGSLYEVLSSPSMRGAFPY